VRTRALARGLGLGSCGVVVVGHRVVVEQLHREPALLGQGLHLRGQHAQLAHQLLRQEADLVLGSERGRLLPARWRVSGELGERDEPRDAVRGDTAQDEANAPRTCLLLLRSSLPRLALVVAVSSAVQPSSAASASSAYASLKA